MHSLTSSWAGYISLFAFVLAYMLVIFEEKLHLRKSKPVVFAGCFMWFIIGIYEQVHGSSEKAHEHLQHLISEIAGLFFFLLVAMTYINTLEERNVFLSLRSWLLRKGLGFRLMYWATGLITFFLSPVADNLTSALLMSTIALSVSNGNAKFIVPCFINIVVAANAGGAWSPFGDITTLMVWTSGKVPTEKFLYLFIPAIINWIIPAVIMFFFVPNETPQGSKESVPFKPGAKVIMFLGGLTIAMAVSFHQFLHLPPFMGMMFGLSFLMFKGYHLKKCEEVSFTEDLKFSEFSPMVKRFDFFRKISNVEFDTLLFFFGILSAVGALQYIGFLTLVSDSLYGTIGALNSNIVIGILSAIIDNIPIMFAVLKMDPAMGLDQWLLVTLTTGVGGSLLSVGSAAGVAVMGVDRVNYTFLNHLKWMPAVAVGYAASILCCWIVTAGLR